MPKEIFRGKGVGRGTVIGELRAAHSIACPPSYKEKPEKVIALFRKAEDVSTIEEKQVLGAVCHPSTKGMRRLWEHRIPLLILDTEALPFESLEGKNAILDAVSGRLTVDPDLEALEEFSKRIRQRDDEEARLLEQADLPAVTLSGRQVSILTQISELSSPPYAALSGILLTADTSEIMNLSEEEQMAAYKELAPKRGYLAVRTPGATSRPDVSADKAKELQKRQLRALLRVSSQLRTMLLMSGITSPEEARRRDALMVEVKNELRRDSIPFGEGIPCGILIDTPKAAVLTDLFAAETDFFILDTELLCTNTATPWDMLGETWAEAVLRLIEMAVKSVQNVRSAKKRAYPFEEGADSRRHFPCGVGITGALACDESFLERSLSLGVDLVALPHSFTSSAKAVIRASK